MNVLNKIAAERIGIFPVNPGERDEIQAAAFRLELGQLGYFVLNPDEFTTISKEAFQELIATLEDLRGGNVSYIPLFTNFPDELPNDSSYFLQRLLGFMGLNTFERDGFGADPISQMQDEALWRRAVEKQQKRWGDTCIEWKPLRLVTESEMRSRLSHWCLSQVYGSTPVKEVLWEDLFALLDQLPIKVDMSRVTIKETLVRLALFQWDEFGAIALKTPTDLLRMFAFKMGQDVSLSNPISLTGLKFSKSNRREIVSFLDKCTSLEEDILRYKGLWLSVAKFLHPGDLAKKHPRVAKLNTSNPEIIYIDLYSAGSRTIESNKQFPDLAKAFSSYNRAKPTFGQLAYWYARANKCKIMGRDRAQVRIGMDSSCDINVLTLAGESVTTLL